MDNTNSQSGRCRLYRLRYSPRSHERIGRLPFNAHRISFFRSIKKSTSTIHKFTKCSPAAYRIVNIRLQIFVLEDSDGNPLLVTILPRHHRFILQPERSNIQRLRGRSFGLGNDVVISALGYVFPRRALPFRSE